jgi:hypothetical protein
VAKIAQMRGKEPGAEAVKGAVDPVAVTLPDADTTVAVSPD